MQISMQVNYTGSFLQAVDQVIAYEKRGLDIAWVAEAYGFDSPTLMGFLAAKTSRIKIGAGIIPIYSRTPGLIAQTAAGLDEVSQGRAILGLGASGPQVIEGWHGVAYDQPIARTREIIRICRSVWAREPLINDGIYQIPLPEGRGTGLGKPLKIITRPVRDNIPIFVASLGDKNVEMTFAVGDGWLPIFYIPEKAEKVWGKAIQAGLEKRDPALGPPEIVGGGILAIGENVEHLRDIGRGVLALYIGGMGAKGKNFYNDLAVKYGYEESAMRIQELYLAGEKTKAMAEVPDELLEATSLIGPKGYVTERVQAYKESGVTILGVTPVGDDPLRSFEKLAEIVHETSR
ncbi:MAG: LLM class F420-dependent oxidoreductase [Acidimicrobiaceae bacterium]|nr:LLM class F420-dependent oxidoreductase [Acidimicrobiaceae bacterium]